MPRFIAGTYRRMNFLETVQFVVLFIDRLSFLVFVLTPNTNSKPCCDSYKPLPQLNQGFFTEQFILLEFPAV